NDFSIMGVRFVSDAYIAQYTNLGQPVGNMVQGPDTTLYLVNAGIKMPFTSCSADVVDYGYTCASNQYVPLTIGQTNKLVSGPTVTKLIKSNSNGTIYYMNNGQKRPFPSWSDLVALHIPISYNVLTSALVSNFPNGSVLYGPGRLVKTTSSATVYMVKNLSKLVPISSFVYPQDLGLSLDILTISDNDLQTYTLDSAIQTKVLCGTTDYVGTNGQNYDVTSSLSTYGFQSNQFIDGGSICSNLPISSQNLGNYIRTSNGTIYYVSNGHKQAVTNWNAYVAHGGSGANTVNVSNYFATLIASGSDITQ
ncbi:MAG TPA: hypothetical protein VLF63_02135, partial [Patescibacteria group bacterium]|nr:hypothetical protein [Patescibacteria group bacterium]